MRKNILAFMTLLIAPFSAHSETIKITNGDWAPYMAESLKHYGVVSHIVSETFALEGITVEYVFLPWKRAYEDAKEGKADGSIIWGFSEERAAELKFSEPVINLETVLFIQKNSTVDWTTEEDLGKYSIGGVIGYSYGIEALETSGKVKISRIASPENNYKKLASGRLEIVLEDRDVGWQLANNLGLTDSLKTHPKPLNTKSFHLLMSKNSAKGDKFLEAFNRGLAKMKASGKLDQMVKDSQEGKYK
jgi:polar amino acid transport system substrate-binding protein